MIVSSLLLAAIVACGGGARNDPILQLSTQEALALGKELMADEKYGKAERYLEHAFEAAPNSREGREALLLSADALYLDGGSDNFIRCEAKYRDFLNRFPTSERSDYAQLQVANCLARRMKKPDRDQEVARKALEAYEELFRLYPTSNLIPEAQVKAEEVTENLAESEILVAHFYIRYRWCRAAIDRLKNLPELYPGYDHQDKALFFLAQAYGDCNQHDQAEETLQKLEREFPDSGYVAQLSNLRAELEKKKKKQQQLQERRLSELGRQQSEQPADQADEDAPDDETGAEGEGEDSREGG